MKTERVFWQPIVVLALSLVLGVAIGSAVEISLVLSMLIFVLVVLVNLYLRTTVLAVLSVVAAGVVISTIELGDRVEQVGFAAELNRSGVEKIESLGLSRDSESLVEAIVLGQRYGMSGELTRAYRLSGASHLLAISGLHVGMVALLLALLLRPVVLLPFGNIALDLLLLVVLWIYAATVGCSTSVVRATIMFSVMLLSKIVDGRYSPMRSLAGAVILLVLISPSIIYSVGFQLSVVAVLAILLWAIPIIKAVHSRFENRGFGAVIGESVLSTILIGVVCSVATMPIISMTFGYVVWWGAVLNPVVIALSYLIVSLSLLWLLIGFGAIAEPFRWAIDTLATAQNELLIYCSTQWSAPIDLRINEWSVAIIYAIYIIVTIIVYRIVSVK